MADAVSIFAIGIHALLFFRERIVAWGHSLAGHIPPASLPPDEKVLATSAAVPTTTYIAAGLTFLSATLAASLVLRALGHPRFASLGLRRMTPAIVAPALVISLVSSARRLASFWGWAVLVALACIAPVFAMRRRDPTPRHGPTLHRAFILGAQAGCSLVGLLLPWAETAGPFLVPAFALGFGAGVLFALTHPERAETLSRAALPLLLLPFFGLRRNPSLKGEFLVVLLAAVTWVVARRVPRVGQALERARERWGVDVALLSLTLLVVLPFRFREFFVADAGGHESQHLGWINSIAHGRMMMADAGFIYGPLREYTLAFVAWSLGGLTLEHVRLAHVAVNAGGLLLFLAAARRAAGRHLGLTILVGVLLLAHSAVVALVNYTNTIAFGWVDEMRAGLATFPVVLALGRQTSEDRRRLTTAGVLAGMAMLYSQDFGFLATFGTLVGLASERFAKDAPATTREVARRAGAYLVGVGASAGLFVVVYVVCGRGRALVDALRWSLRVGAGLLTPALLDYPISTQSFSSAESFFGGLVDHIGAGTSDYFIIPALPVVGLAATFSAGILRGWNRRNVLLLGLGTFCLLTMRHPLITADGWHIANAGGPVLVLVAALLDAARGLRIPRTGLRVGALLGASLAAAWLLTGGARPLAARLARLANDEERPSVGAPYVYADLPRAGDMFVDDEHLIVARHTRANTSPDETIFATTWLLGGGVDAFLSDRKNAVRFDVPVECQTDTQRAQALADLRSAPPQLVLGSYFSDFGPEVDAWVRENYVPGSLPGARTPIATRKTP